MSWPSPDNGSQNSWTTRAVVGILAFVLLIGIGYYNGRKNHPEIFDTEAVATQTPNVPARPHSYPQIDLNEEETENAGQQAELSSPSGKAEKPSAAKDTPSAAEAKKTAQTGSGSPTASPVPSAAASETPKTSASQQSAPIASPSKAAGTNKSADQSKKAAAPPAAPTPTASPEKRPNSHSDTSVSPAPAATVDPSEVSDLVYDDSWPSPQDHPRTESTFLQRIPSMLFFLILTCALIWISLRIIAPFSDKLTGNAAPKKQINVIERKSLGPNKAVVLIEVSGKRLVLGLTEKTISTLAELECPPPPADSDKPETDKSAEEKNKKAPARDLVKEVIAKHLAALPTLK